MNEDEKIINKLIYDIVGSADPDKYIEIVKEFDFKIYTLKEERRNRNGREKSYRSNK